MSSCLQTQSLGNSGWRGLRRILLCSPSATLEEDDSRKEAGDPLSLCGGRAGCAHTCMWRSEVTVEMSSSIPFPLTFWASISHGTRNSIIRLASWPANPRNPPVSVPCLQCWGTGVCTISGFLPDFWDSNSDLHACAVSILPAEASSQTQVSLLVPSNK